MFNTFWQGFPRCHVAFVIKRLLYIEFSVFKKRGGGGWRCRKGLKRGYCMFRLRQEIPCHDRVQEMPRQATAGFGSPKFFLVLCCDRNFCVTTWFSNLKQ